MNTEQHTLFHRDQPNLSNPYVFFIHSNSWPLTPSQMANRSNVGFPPSSSLISQNMWWRSWKQLFSCLLVVLSLCFCLHSWVYMQQKQGLRWLKQHEISFFSSIPWLKYYSLQVQARAEISNMPSTMCVTSHTEKPSLHHLLSLCVSGDSSIHTLTFAILGISGKDVTNVLTIVCLLHPLCKNKGKILGQEINFDPWGYN